MEAKFTPGPWKLSELGKSDQICEDSAHSVDAIDPKDGGLFEIAAVWGIDDAFEESATSLANARLIAAAPELLEACVAMSAHYSASLDHQPAYVRIARAAIAKAEGR